MTRRELRKSLSRSGRGWLKQVCQAAQKYTLRLSRLSPVTSPLATELIDDYMAELNLAGEETHHAFFLTLVAGYSARAVLAEPTEQPRLRPVPRDGDGLADRIRAIAVDEFGSVMTLPPEVWSGYVATAANKQQRWLTSHKLPWYMLERDRVERLLRLGYVLRCLDEARRAEPVLESAPRRVTAG
jgi:hypothetical protein